MHNHLKINLGKIVAHIMYIFSSIDTHMDGMADDIGDIDEKLSDIKTTLHDTNIISFTVTGTTSGTVTYVRL